jgi:hypothetical protein
MRRGLGLLLAAILLVAAGAPWLDAARGSKLPPLPSRLPLQPAPGVPARRVVSAPAPPTPPNPNDWVGLTGLGLASAGMLALGLLAAGQARRAKTRQPPKRTREGGRARARQLAVHSTDEALAVLASARLGAVLEATPIPGGARITIDRPKGHPCDEVAGYLAGLFESAWALDVQVQHAECAGRAGACRYQVTREPRLSAAASRAAAASTPGWSAAARRSPRARGGAG